MGSEMCIRDRIATMALDLLEHINRLEIPHLPGTKFRLRTGCHSGIHVHSSPTPLVMPDELVKSVLSNAVSFLLESVL